MRISIASRRAFLSLTLLVVVLTISGPALARQDSPLNSTFRATFTVNTTDDLDDGTCDATHCSLREAINAANVDAAGDLIAFNIPGAGPHTIQPLTRLPNIMETITIDGYTEPDAKLNTLVEGTNAEIMIELDGSLMPGNPGVHKGFTFTGGANSIIRGLVINRFIGGGVQLEGGTVTGTTIAGNFFDMDQQGLTSLGPTTRTVTVIRAVSGASGTTVGGPNLADRNLISGVILFGTLPCTAQTGNTVEGNLFGTDATGTTAAGGLPATSVQLRCNTSMLVKHNTMAYGVAGIVIADSVSTGNTFSRNSIHSMQFKGIALGGWNHIQNSPEITSINGRTINGRMEGPVGGSYTIELFYSTETTTEQGSGQGETYLGTVVGTTGADNAFTFSETYDLPTEGFITATATAEDGSTSEFSPPVAVPARTTFTVNTTTNTDDGACNTSHCSLREAINAANADPSDDIIAFNIPGTGPHTIQPAGSSYFITEAVIIDGYTQSGASENTLHIGTNAVLKIEIDGANVGNDLVVITGPNVTVKGLAINRAGLRGLQFGPNATGGIAAGNFIGTDVTGTSALPNLADGVLIFDGASSNTIGGPNPADRNLISGNAGDGISFNFSASSGTTIQNNLIGTDASGLLPLPNAINGVDIRESSGNILIDNTIAFNSSNGIRVRDATTLGNIFSQNRVYANGGLGIDLGGDGVTANDPGDTDTGANGLVNFPDITQVDDAGLQGTYSGVASASHRIEFFRSSAPDGTGFGEGETYLGFLDITTDGAGDASFSFPVTLDAGNYVTATATDATGNTSEFSATAAFSRLQVYHALNGVDSIDVYVADTLFANDIVFRDGTGFLRVEPSTATIDIVEATAADNSSPLISEPLTIEPQNYYIAAQGTSASDAMLGVIGDRRAVVPIDSVGVFFYNAVPDVPGDMVDFRQADPRDFDVILGDLEDGVGFGEASGYVRLKAGTYAFETMSSDGSTFLGTFLFDFTEEAGQGIALTLSGLVGGAGKDGSGTSMTQSDPTETEQPIASDESARFQFIYTDMNGPAYKLFLNEGRTPLRATVVGRQGRESPDRNFDNLTAGKAEPLAFIDPGEYTFDLKDEAGNSVSADFTIRPKVSYYLLLQKNREGQLALAAVDSIRTSGMEGEPAFNIFHTAPDLGQATFKLITSGGETPIGNVDFLGDSDYVEAPQGDVMLRVEDTAGVALADFPIDMNNADGTVFMVNVMGAGRTASEGLGVRLYFQDGTSATDAVGTDIEVPFTETPVEFRLRGAYPNPFNPSTTLLFDLPEAAEVRVELYNVLGQRVMTLPPEMRAAGSRQHVRVDASSLASGMYLYRIEAQGAAQTHTATGRAVLIR